MATTIVLNLAPISFVHYDLQCALSCIISLTVTLKRFLATLCIVLCIWADVSDLPWHMPLRANWPMPEGARALNLEYQS